MNATPVSRTKQSLTLVGRLMLIEAVTFAIASILHFGVAESFIGAAIPEAIIAVVLGAGSIAVIRRGTGSRWIGRATTLFALAGVVIGLSVILGGRASRPTDVAYDGTLLVGRLITVGFSF